MPKLTPDNETIAGYLERVAELLEAQEENPFRVRSYRNGAAALRRLQRPAAELLQEQGLEGLEAIEGIGPKLAGSIQEVVRTGRLGLLDRLESEMSPEAVLTQVPGIGVTLARRIRAKLGIRTLEELELAAHEGALEQIEGLGERRIKGIQSALAGMLSRSATRRSRHRQRKAQHPSAQEQAENRQEQPPVELLLEIDEEYRRKAEAGRLKKIAPRRFNPQGKAWLPVMKSQRKQWSFTVLFSNTARAHDLGRTRDWVVIYYEKDGLENQATVVTGDTGPLRGKRIVRGREPECRHYYQDGEV